MNTTDGLVAPVVVGDGHLRVAGLAAPSAAASVRGPPRRARRRGSDLRPSRRVNATSARSSVGVRARGAAARSAARPVERRRACVADSVSSCIARDGSARGAVRRLLDDDVGVGAAGAEPGDAGDPRRPASTCPRAQLGVDEERAVREVGLRVGRLVVEARRELAVLQRQHGLDERGDARRLAGVADVGLQRADRAELVVVGALPVRLRERRRSRSGRRCSVPVPCAST